MREVHQMSNNNLNKSVRDALENDHPASPDKDKAASANVATIIEKANRLLSDLQSAIIESEGLSFKIRGLGVASVAKSPIC
jgi:hypothetical protein